MSRSRFNREVENWVNALVKEGYDLSKYTWEDMYDLYLNEAPTFQNTGGYGRYSPPVSQVKTPAPQPKLGSINAQGKFYTGKQYGYQSWDTATAKRLLPSEVLGSEKPNRFPIGRTDPFAPVGPARPRSTQVRPVGPSQPSNSKPSISSTPPPLPGQFDTPNKGKYSEPPPPPSASSSKPSIPSKPSLQSGIEDLQRMGAASLMRQQGRNLPSGKIPVGADLKSHFDLFDVVKGHLLDEGYADTEEAALAIMANMSEEWRQSILEAGEHIGSEPKTVGGRERPGVKGEIYEERRKRMKPGVKGV